jgi:rhamnosyltransferase
MHWDKDNLIDDYVIEYIKGLKEISNDIVFVSNCRISDSEKNKISSLCSNILTRDNKGLDFGAWQYALNILGKKELLRYDEVIIANDSCYAPIFPFEKMFSEMKSKECDFWGVTENDATRYKGKDIPMHLQSYFLVFRKRLFSSEVFWDFFNSIDINASRIDIILKYETTLTQTFNNAGYKSEAFLSSNMYKSLEKDYSMFEWKLLLNQGNPLLKKKVFRDTMKLCIARYFDNAYYRKGYRKIMNWKLIIKKTNSTYNTELIKSNLTRYLSTFETNMYKGIAALIIFYLYFLAKRIERFVFNKTKV